MNQVWRAILADADELGAIRSGLSAVRQRADPSRARDLIALRRRLADALVSISHHVRTLTASDLSADGSAETGRRLLSQAQSKVAMHQANWPAVKLNYDDEGYTASARSADTAIEALAAWIRQHTASS